MKFFTLTKEHVALLRAANVRWDDYNYGAPRIDSKRPYGNSETLRDICRIIGEKPAASIEEFEEEQLSKAQTDRYYKLHRETETALQIFLTTGEMKPGRYGREDFGEWTLIEDESSW